MKWQHSIVSSATDADGNPVKVETFLTGAVEFVGSKGIGKEMVVGECAWDDLPASVMEALMEYGLGQKLGDAYSGAKGAAIFAVAGNKTPGESDAAYAARCDAVVVTSDLWQAEASAMFDKAKAQLCRGQWAGDRGRKAGARYSADMLDFFLPHASRAAPGLSGLKAPERRAAIAGWLQALPEDRKAKATAAWQGEVSRRAEEAARIADLDI